MMDRIAHILDGLAIRVGRHELRIQQAILEPACTEHRPVGKGDGLLDRTQRREACGRVSLMLRCDPLAEVIPGLSIPVETSIHQTCEIRNQRTVGKGPVRVISKTILRARGWPERCARPGMTFLVGSPSCAIAGSRYFSHIPPIHGRVVTLKASSPPVRDSVVILASSHLSLGLPGVGLATVRPSLAAANDMQNDGESSR